jgi:hypothetical protein
MVHSPHHEHLLLEINELFGPLLKESKKAIYIYLDDEHKTCNKKFADLLGYKSVEEWVKFEFPVSDVLESDQEKVVEAYMGASKKFKSSEVTVTLVKKDGKKIKAGVLMIPFSYGNEIFVLHFITPQK